MARKLTSAWSDIRQYARSNTVGMVPATLDVREGFVDSQGRSHRCQACLIDWPMPRTIIWPREATAPEGLLQIPSTTPDTLVVTQTFDKQGHPSIPAEVFQTFTFADEGRNGERGPRSLVQGVRYSKPGGHCPGKRSPQASHGSPVSQGSLHSQSLVRMTSSSNMCKEEDDLDRSHAYLRLMTLNNWYWMLFQAIALIIMMAFEVQGNVMLSAALLSDAELRKALGTSRFVFIAAWTFMFLVSLYYAYREATVEWIMKTNAAKGDLISNCCKQSRLQTFLAMVAFEYFLLEKDVKDILVTLHPWKTIQDYSAFKAEGHRAFFIGFRSKAMHRAENVRSVWYVLPKQLAARICALAFKVYFIHRLFVFEDQHQVSFPLLVSTCTSVVAVVWDICYLWSVFRIRQLFYHRIVYRLRNLQHDDPQRTQDQRMLALLFRRVWDNSKREVRYFKRHEMRLGHWINGHFQDSTQKVEQQPCSMCGRRPQDEGCAGRGHNPLRQVANFTGNVGSLEAGMEPIQSESLEVEAVNSTCPAAGAMGADKPLGETLSKVASWIKPTAEPAAAEVLPDSNSQKRASADIEAWCSTPGSLRAPDTTAGPAPKAPGIIWTPPAADPRAANFQGTNQPANGVVSRTPELIS